MIFAHHATMLAHLSLRTVALLHEMSHVCTAGDRRPDTESRAASLAGGFCTLNVVEVLVALVALT